nr:hypothetical protein [Flavobacterium sp.]
MLTTNEVAQVFDTILSSPGMNEAVKIDLRISRKTVLLLHQVIEHGVSKKGEGELFLFASASEETLTELKGLGTDCLQRAGLVELSEKLLQLSNPNKK